MIAVGLLLSVAVGLALGFFGGGGSILTVPLLVYVFGLNVKEAIATSLVVVGVASAFGAVRHAREGNVRPRQALTFGAAGMLGAYAGGRASGFVDGTVLLLLFAAMMLLTSVAMLRAEDAPEDRHDATPPTRAAALKLATQGLAVGAFTGLIGAGGGFLIVPALALWAGLPMPVAVGTSLLVIVLKSGAAFLGTLSHVRIDYALAASVSVAAILGALIGSALASRVRPALLRRGFAGFVMAMGTLIIVRETATLSNALPQSLPEVAFALGMLGVGALAGRASAIAASRHAEIAWTDGAGI